MPISLWCNGNSRYQQLVYRKEIVDCISPNDLKILIDDGCLQLNHISAVQNLFPNELLPALKKYQGKHTITIWHAIQKPNQTIFIPPLFGHCTSSVWFFLSADLCKFISGFGVGWLYLHPSLLKHTREADVLLRLCSNIVPSDMFQIIATNLQRMFTVRFSCRAS